MKLFLMTAAGVSSLMLAGQANAQARDFDIPAQPATTGIPLFGRQADLQILAAQDAVRGKQVNAVQGRYTPEEGLSRLLRAVGLVVVSNNGRTAVVAEPVEVAQDALVSGRAERSSVAPAALSEGAAAEDRTPPPAASNVAEVVVVGQRAAVVESIDRKTYNITRDLFGANGSVTDVLRNLPSVDVNADGEVSLRGQSVQILMDGKPSAMLSGASRAQALQQLAASTVESIEVMTNPSAEFSPDGVGGIINIVSKRVRATGNSGSIAARVGSFGRWSATGIAAYKQGPLTLNSNLGAQHDARNNATRGEMARIDPLTGRRSDTTSSSDGELQFTSLSTSTTVDFDLTGQDRLTLNVGGVAGEVQARMMGTQVRRENGGVTRDYDTLININLDNRSVNLSTGWRRTFGDSGRVFNLTARQSYVDVSNLSRTAYRYRTSVADRDEDYASSTVVESTGLLASYVLPLADKATWKFGYDYRRDLNDSDTVGRLINPAGPATNMPDVTNRFVYVETNHQAYATFQRLLGKLTVLAGGRLEHAAIEYDQRTSAITGDDDYFDIHPTFHLQYTLTPAQTLRLSYSHRVQRPSAAQLNPFIVVRDEFNALAGNPDLRPQETHSVEAGWQWVGQGGASLGATVYYRQNYNTIDTVNRFVTPTLLLSMPENQGTSSSGGVELDAGGRWGERLTYRANANIFYNEVQRSTFAGGGSSSAFSYTLRGNIDYRLTEKDLLQITASRTGKQIFGQGYRLPSHGVNLGYQRKIRADLIFVATVSDVFASTRFTTITDTPAVFGRSDYQQAGRTFSLGITRLLGGRPAREGQFEYDVAAPPPS